MKKAFFVLTSLLIASCSQAGSDISSSAPAAPSTASEAATYYIDASAGSDANDGLTETSPWQTLDKASQVKLKAGDRMLLKAGTVFNGVLELYGKGSSNKRIEVGRYGEGNAPKIVGHDNADYAVRILNSEYLTISGLVLNPEVHWISFHGSYDFAYMLRLLLNTELPETEAEFTEELIEYFPSHYDIRILVQGKENLKGGLNRLAQYLEVLRVGKTHQAGSDSVVTADVFFKLIQNNFIDMESVEQDKNILFGLGEGANDEETIQYTKFNTNINGGSYNYMTNANMVAPSNKNNIPLNVMYPPYMGQQYGYGYGVPITSNQITLSPTANSKKGLVGYSS